MTADTDILSDPVAGPPEASPAPASPTRPFYWSVRRELWENRSIYIAPLAVAGVFLFGFLLSRIGLAHSRHDLAAYDRAQLDPAVVLPYHLAAALVVVTGIVVAVVYCLGALHGERRDRSILFWKSLPVSDLTTVLAKASVPLAILPAVVFVIVIALQFVMLLLTTAVLLAHGVNASSVWLQVAAPSRWLVLIYGLAVLSLWYAPIYAWLILVSGWARRVTFLWAVLPPLGLCLVEKIAFDTTAFASLLGRRLGGAFAQAFSNPSTVHDPMGRVEGIDPAKFLSSLDLWTGLAVAAALLAAAVWLRRRREPI